VPTYEYVCKSCGEHVEVVQSFSDDSLTECPTCGGPLRKVFGSIGISFKGSGFYRTDSRPVATKKEKDAGEKSDAKTKEPASATDGAKEKAKEKASSGSSDSTVKSDTSSSKPDSSSSKSGGSDKAKAAATPASG